MNPQTDQENAISASEISSGAKLRLTVKESNHIALNKVFVINPGGLEGSGRYCKDGYTYFGNEQNQSVDIMLPESEGVGKMHMCIKYDQFKKKYFLRDLGEGTGTFIMITEPVELKHGYVVSFGDSHLVTQICQRSIVLKFLEGPKAEEIFEFSPEDGSVSVGRMNECKIKFDDNNLSRVQCTVTFKEPSSWFMVDGDGTKNSTNGTWVFAEDFIEIHDGMNFKVGQTLFNVKVIQLSLS